MRITMRTTAYDLLNEVLNAEVVDMEVAQRWCEELAEFEGSGCVAWGVDVPEFARVVLLLSQWEFACPCSYETSEEILDRWAVEGQWDLWMEDESILREMYGERRFTELVGEVAREGVKRTDRKVRNQRSWWVNGGRCEH